MTKYYVDVETTGLDYCNDQILSIQLFEIDEKDDKFNEVIKLWAWESSEEKILSIFWQIYKQIVKTHGVFGFIFVGYNLNFDLAYLWHRGEKYSIDMLYLNFTEFMFRIPILDLRHTIILLNKGVFKGTALSNFSPKKEDGQAVLEHYKSGEYEKIGNYIEEENTAFEQLYWWLKKMLPALRSSMPF